MNYETLLKQKMELLERTTTSESNKRLTKRYIKHLLMASTKKSTVKIALEHIIFIFNNTNVEMDSLTEEDVEDVLMAIETYTYEKNQKAKPLADSTKFAIKGDFNTSVEKYKQEYRI